MGRLRMYQFSASLRGTLEISHGRIMEGGNAVRRFHADAPAGLTEALVLGFTRMGILHNLARLTRGAAPDHADGGVREWVEVRDVHVVPAATREE
jgi:hypothetical protein